MVPNLGYLEGRWRVKVQWVLPPRPPFPQITVNPPVKHEALVLENPQIPEACTAYDDWKASEHEFSGPYVNVFVLAGVSFLSLNTLRLESNVHPFLPVLKARANRAPHTAASPAGPAEPLKGILDFGNPKPCT